MTTFGDQLHQFAKNTGAKANAVFVASNVELEKSIKFGSALTGAPPLPVAIPKYFRAGALRDSVTTRYIDDNTAIIFTTKWYAPNVEFNTENHTFSSGAPHGWGLTIAAFSRVVDHTAARITGGR
jgi:hypothetical protein